jgi:hypothetical protein
VVLGLFGEDFAREQIIQCALQVGSHSKPPERARRIPHGIEFRFLRNPADSQAIENSDWIPLFFVASDSVREAKNRISRKIKNVAEVSKVSPEIQSNPGKSKTVAEHSNRQPNVRRSAGNSNLQRIN